MIEIIWRYDTANPTESVTPGAVEGARLSLEEGNAVYAAFVNQVAQGATHSQHVVTIALEDLGISGQPGKPPKQEPFAAILGCADARVPVELIFNQQANELFVVRVAGNVLGEECRGSLDFAVTSLSTLRLLVVLGHTGCGAVSAAVDAFLHPGGYLGVAINPALRAIVDAIVVVVRGAASALEQVHGHEAVDMPGYRAALVELSVALNAALGAAALRHFFRDQLGDHLDVVYGVYNLGIHSVGLPARGGEAGQWQAGLCAPPPDEASMSALTMELAGSRFIAELLHEAPPAGSTH